MAIARFSVSARADMWDIFAYIAQDKPIAAAKWIETIEGKCESIAASPDFGEPRPEFGAGIRSHVVGRYVIFFRDIENGIEVVRVVAGDRDIKEL